MSWQKGKLNIPQGKIKHTSNTRCVSSAMEQHRTCFDNTGSFLRLSSTPTMQTWYWEHFSQTASQDRPRLLLFFRWRNLFSLWCFRSVSVQHEQEALWITSCLPGAGDSSCVTHLWPAKQHRLFVLYHQAVHNNMTYLHIRTPWARKTMHMKSSVLVSVPCRFLWSEESEMSGGCTNYCEGNRGHRTSFLSSIERHNDLSFPSHWKMTSKPFRTNVFRYKLCNIIPRRSWYLQINYHCS